MIARRPSIMVNEINKPSDGPPDNEQLGQRLAASNQALVEMQTEHQQLLEEMEQLRLRAQQLQRVREQQDIEEVERIQQYEQSMQQTTMSSSTSSRSVAQEVMQVRCTTTEEVTVEEVDEDESPEDADYIKAKLAEIAQLKAQFKRVQNMISTTEMIEKHISKASSSTVAEIKQAAESVRSASSSMTKQESHEVVQQTAASSSSAVSMESAIEQSVTSSSSETTATATSSGAVDEKEQLLVAMLDMFQDFNTDLKSQAESIRTERERIKALKENIIRSKQEEPPK